MAHEPAATFSAMPDPAELTASPELAGLGHSAPISRRSTPAA
jgi:hypothetical protein